VGVEELVVTTAGLAGIVMVVMVVAEEVDVTGTVVMAVAVEPSEKVAVSVSIRPGRNSPLR
jgi:hypothetical protein